MGGGCLIHYQRFIEYRTAIFGLQPDGLKLHRTIKPLLDGHGKALGSLVTYSRCTRIIPRIAFSDVPCHEHVDVLFYFISQTFTFTFIF